MKDIHVQSSGIHGQGVFTDEDIEAGEIIHPITGQIVFFEIKDKNDSLSHPNWIGMGPNQRIDPVDTPMRYINHSCEPNVGAISDSEENMSIVAMKPLKKGDELTLDYSIIEGDPGWEMKCECGSSNCRKIISSVTSIPKDQYEKYLPYIPEYFKELYAEKLNT